MVDATTEVMWVQAVLQELRIPCPSSARLWCDNLGTKYLASDPVFHGRIKHVEIDYHFVGDRVVKKLLMFGSLALMINSQMDSPRRCHKDGSVYFGTIST
jgi:hypothetical protein